MWHRVGWSWTVTWHRAVWRWIVTVIPNPRIKIFSWHSDLSVFSCVQITEVQMILNQSLCWSTRLEQGNQSFMIINTLSDLHLTSEYANIYGIIRNGTCIDAHIKRTCVHDTWFIRCTFPVWLFFSLEGVHVSRRHISSCLWLLLFHSRQWSKLMMAGSSQTRISGRLVVGSCMLVCGCRDQFLMRTLCCQLDRRRFELKMIRMLYALSSSCVFPLQLGASRPRTCD